MSAPMVAMVVLVVVLGAAVLALSYRLWKLRQGGTAGVMRDIPAVGGPGWRARGIRHPRRRGRVLPAVQPAVVAGSPAQPARCGDRGPTRAARRRIRHHDRRDRGPG